MGDIGPVRRKVDLEPLPEMIPLPEPEPSPEPSVPIPREPVPA